jgi:hypothetical protein
MNIFFYLTKVDRNVQSVEVEVQEDAEEEPDEKDKEDEEIFEKKTRVKMKLKKKIKYVEYKFWSKRKKKLVEHIAKDKLHQHEVKEVKQFFELISSVVSLANT